MTEQEAIDILGEFQTDKFILEMIYEECHEKALRMAISALEEIQQYRALGTVEELREAREKQVPKKAEHVLIKHGKHTWRKGENGKIDIFAWDSDYHNGVVCEICDKTVCVHCNPEYDELEDCEEEYFVCPNCGKKFYSKIKYCDCGQAIDFSEVEERGGLNEQRIYNLCGRF